MNIKKMTSLVLTLLLALAMAVPAMASGLTGTITISNATDGTSASGRTFEAYRILDVTLAADGVTPAYSVPSSMQSFYATQFTLDFSGKTQAQINAAVIAAIDGLKTDDDAMQEFAEAAVAAAKLASVPHVTVLGGATTPVPYGYYVIEQTSGLTGDARVSSVMVSTTNPDAEIVLKADTPNIVKAIVDGEEPDSDNVSIGDEVKYQITTKVPDMTGFEDKYFFIVTDTLSAGLDFNNNVVVTLGGATLTAGDDYYVNWTSPDGKTFEVVFKDFIQYKGDDEGKPIVITYSATLNDAALVGEVGNPNSAKLTYSNNPQNEGEGMPGDEPEDDTVVGESPLDKTITYTTGIHLTKVDEEGDPLSGAKFKLEGTSLNLVVVEGEVFTRDDAGGSYWLLKDGTYTTEAPTDLTKGLYASETNKYKKEIKTTITSTGTTTKVVEGWVGADGVLKFDGLSAGTYTLTELVAPSGYNLLTAPIVIEITWTKPAGPIANGNETATWTVVSAKMGDEDVTTAVVSGIVTLDVKNNKGSLLPSTGGMGTTLFTIGGIVLMGAAVLLLVLKRKKSKA